MRKFKLFSLALAALMAVSMFAGCAPKTPSSTSTAADSTSAAPTDAKKGHEEFVKLKFYIQGSPLNDQERIMEKANKIIKEELNAELELIVVDSVDKVNLMISSGEEFDLCFTAFWGGNNFWGNAADGAYVDLAPLMQTYAPESYARIPEGLWQGVSIGESIYAVPNYQQWGSAKRNGFRVRLDLADEFGLDWQSLKGKPTLEVFEALTPWMEQVKEKYPDMIGWETSAINTCFFEPLYWDMEAVGDQNDPGWITYTDDKTVINQFETPEFTAYCDQMRKWYLKGLMRQDGATLKDPLPDRQAGKIMVQWDYAWPDVIDFPPTGVKELTLQGYKDAGYEVIQMSQAETPDFKYPGINFSNTRTVIPATAASNACVAVSATSKNPERALELIELLNTNDDLFNLIQMGEEGIDYIYDETGALQMQKDKYCFNWNEWQLGQSYSPDFTRSFFGKNQQAEDKKAKCNVVFEADKTATVSPLSGFQFNADPIKTELSNCASIITEMMPSLNNGALDPKTAVPELQQRLKDAGVDTVIAEKQKQLDAFYAANA